MFAGGYLGRHLGHRRRIGVAHADRSPEPRDFTAVARLRELEEDRPRKVVLRDAEEGRDVPVVLVRHRGRVHAMGARCSHLGGPLDQGWALEGQLVCPWHGSRFALGTAQPTSGPSSCAQPRYPPARSRATRCGCATVWWKSGESRSQATPARCRAAGSRCRATTTARQARGRGAGSAP
jgi:nitrite reductase/ring-hydroxylating ferredoxin subunit